MVYQPSNTTADLLHVRLIDLYESGYNINVVDTLLIVYLSACETQTTVDRIKDE
jgi:hypothetical protein